MTVRLLTKSFLLATGVTLAGTPLLSSAALAQQQQTYLPSWQTTPYESNDSRSRPWQNAQDDEQQPSYPGGYPQQGYAQQGYPQQGVPQQGYAPSQADADDAPPPPGPGGYGRPSPQTGYNSPPPPPPPPQGYDGSQPPPPPPGYQAGPDAARQQAQDQQYATYAQQWAQAYCVKAHGDAGTGAVIGGIAGALLGSSVAGRHNRGAGAILGAGVGAVGGAAVADSSGSNATSPGCPPGYVTRGGAPAFSYGGYAGAPYVYAAPAWYRPWTFYGGAWVYRPYPYHVWYYGHYARPYYGRPHYGYRRRW